MKISSEIEKVAKSNAIYINKLSEKDAWKVKQSITEKYIDSQGGVFLWENLKSAAIIQDNNGWQNICDFVGSKVCLMLFDDTEDKTVFIFKNGENLYKLLYEMYGFEFYITDFETQYLMCFNHHDCLLGCGLAKKWVESLK